MASMSPPQGMSEVDYEAIEAAVTETVRGRWFLNEFARRNRSVELRQLLEAMNRLEGVVAAGQTTLPPADPSIRLMMQRIKEVAGHLDALSIEMRTCNVDERFAAVVDEQARAVAGLLRGPAPAKLSPPSAAVSTSPPQADAARLAHAISGVAPGTKPAPLARDPVPPSRAGLPRPGPADQPPTLSEVAPDDPRLQLLSEIDQLSLDEKLAFFA